MPEQIEIPHRGRLRVFGRGETLPGVRGFADECVVVEWLGRAGHASSYGLLGATAADEPTKTTIDLRASDHTFAASLAGKMDEVKFGLVEEYGESIVEAASVFAFPMTVRVAAHGAIGSSSFVFSRLADLLGPLVHVPEAERTHELVTLWWERAWSAREWGFNVDLPESYIDLRADDPLTRASRSELTAEVHREVGPGHRLHGRAITVIARDTARDDVLVFVKPNRFALVHLTYTSTPPDRAPWPIATFVLDRGQLEEQWAIRS